MYFKNRICHYYKVYFLNMIKEIWPELWSMYIGEKHLFHTLY